MASAAPGMLLYIDSKDMSTSSASVGCVVEVIQRTQDEGNDDTLFLARGLQRMCLQGDDAGKPTVPCLVLPHESSLCMPREAAEGRCHVPAWACRMYDCKSLARRVHDIVSRVAPNLQPPAMDPLRLSYWLLRTLPLEYVMRQELLEMDSVAQRLHAELDVLQGMSTLYCMFCRHEVQVLRGVTSAIHMFCTGGQALRCHQSDRGGRCSRHLHQPSWLRYARHMMITRCSTLCSSA